MSTAPTATRPGTGLLSAGIDPNITCNYCKKPGHIKDDCRKLKRKEEQRRNEGQDTKKEYPKMSPYHPHHIGPYVQQTTN